MCLIFLACTLLTAQSALLQSKAQQAKEAMDAGRFAEAARLYAELTHDLPGNPGLRMDWALAIYSEGEYRDAAGQLQIVLRQQKDNASAWLMMGLTQLKLERLTQAVSALERAIKIEPGNQTAHLGLADAWLRLHQPERSVAEYKRLSQYDPENPRVWQGLGLGYAALSRELFREIEKWAPDSPYEDALLGQSLLDQHHYRAAFGFYRRALAKAPDLPGLHGSLAEVYEKTGHRNWAEIEVTREQRIPAPDCKKRPLECDFRAGNYERLLTSAHEDHSARANYWEARAYQCLSLQAFTHLSQMPPSPEVHELLAEAYTLQGQYHTAVTEWESAVRLAPRQEKLQEGLARALWLDHQYPSARSLLERLIKQEADSAQLNFELGDALLHVGKAPDSLVFLKKAVALAPDLVPAQSSLALAYLRTGRASAAIPHLRRALAAGSNATVLYELAEAYQQTGQKAHAARAMQEFAALSNASLRRTQKLDQQSIIAP